MLLAFLLSFSAHADNWMRVADVSAGLVRGFELEQECKRGGAACQKVDGLPLHALKVTSGVIVVDAVKAKEKDDKDKAGAQKEKIRGDRVKRIEQQCANAEGLVKELCDFILDN